MGLRHTHVNNLAHITLYTVNYTQDIKILTEGFYGNVHEYVAKYDNY